MACLVIGLLPLAAGLLRIQSAAQASDAGPAGRATCYVLYWKEDPWVQALAAAAERAELPAGWKVEVASATRFTRPDGQIVYPPGAHSIQIRPLEDNPEEMPGWLIWYWYSGPDSSVLEPFSRWFWETTHRHFRGRPAWQVRVSPLTSQVEARFGMTRITAADLRSFLAYGPALVWLGLFFAAGYLPLVSLAQEREHRTILSLVVTPCGWWGVALAKMVFYFVIAAALCLLLVTILRPSGLASLNTWLVLGLAAAAYLGIAWTLGSLCRTAVSASAGLVFYGLMSGLLIWAGRWLETPVLDWFLVEPKVWMLLGGAPAGKHALPLFLVATFWCVAGTASYRKSWQSS